jgi:hypothetical protein
MLLDFPQLGGKHTEEAVLSSNFGHGFARCHLNRESPYNVICMAEQEEDRRPKFKTYVKGTFLLSEDGLEYKEQNDEGKQVEKVVEDKIGFMSLQKQIEKEKTEKNDREKLAKKRNNSIVDKPTLIPIKDTPVDPVPEPILDNQKCEIATQEQFEYFQSYISQR